MRLGDLIDLLQQWDPEMDVVIEARDLNEIGMEDGDILQIEDERSLMVQYDKLHIIGDLTESED